MLMHFDEYLLMHQRRWTQDRALGHNPRPMSARKATLVGPTRATQDAEQELDLQWDSTIARQMLDNEQDVEKDFGP